MLETTPCLDYGMGFSARKARDFGLWVSRLGTSGARRPPPEDKGQDEKDQKQDEKHLSDPKSRPGDTAETQRCRDKSENKKCKSPTQHDNFLFAENRVQYPYRAYRG